MIFHSGGELKLDRACFEMAARAEAGCALVKNVDLRKAILDLWTRLLQEHGVVDERLQAAEGQQNDDGSPREGGRWTIPSWSRGQSEF